MKNELYIGLDVHNETITAAVAEPDRNGEVHLVGTIRVREERLNLNLQ